MDEKQRASALDRIQQNIDRHGHHVYVVAGGPEPRFAYTIGVEPNRGFELLLAGAAFYSNDEVVRIINEVTKSVDREHLVASGVPGSFSLRPVHWTWVEMLMLGALDYYRRPAHALLAMQIVPDSAHFSIDIPDLHEVFSPAKEAPWRWIDQPWPYPVPSTSTAVTNIDALQGLPITEATRWEEDEWELFAGAGADIQKEDLRVVPLGTMVAADPSLEPVINLQIGSGLWRRDGSEWHVWERRS